jgi:peptide/nickel transport system substrate-binding protein
MLGSTRRKSSTRIRADTRRTSWARARSIAEYQLGQSIKGVRNPDYYHPGLPYLDGFTGIYADKQAVRVDAIRADRAAMEFRGLPPSAGDQLVKELSDKIAVQESDWNCGNLVTPNHKKKPFDDVRVRRALLLAVDQWHGAPALAKIANVHTVGGIVFPGSPLAATKEELQQIAGFWPDIEKSRSEAKRLLKGGLSVGRKNSGSRLTRCWREKHSNPRCPDCERVTPFRRRESGEGSRG